MAKQNHKVNYAPELCVQTSARISSVLLQKIQQRASEYEVPGGINEFMRRATRKFVNAQEPKLPDFKVDYSRGKALIPVCMEPSLIAFCKETGKGSFTDGLEQTLSWWFEQDKKVRKKFKPISLADQLKLAALDVELFSVIVQEEEEA